MSELLPVKIDERGDDLRGRQEAVELVNGEPVIPLGIALDSKYHDCSCQSKASLTNCFQ